MLETMAEVEAVVTYRVRSPSGESSWYRDHELQAASIETQLGSVAKEADIESRVIDVLGFLGLNTASAGDVGTELGQHEHAKRLSHFGVAKPDSFLGVKQRHEQARAARAAGIKVLSSAGAPIGEVSGPQRASLLREELAVGVEGWGRTLRLLGDYGTGGGAGELVGALAVLGERALAGKTWALHFHEEGAEWAGAWAFPVDTPSIMAIYP